MTFREWKITNYYYNGVRSVKAYFSFKKNIDLKSYFSRYASCDGEKEVIFKAKYLRAIRSCRIVSRVRYVYMYVQYSRSNVANL